MYLAPPPSLAPVLPSLYGSRSRAHGWVSDSHILGHRWLQPPAFLGLTWMRVGSARIPPGPTLCRALAKLGVQAWPVGRAAVAHGGPGPVSPDPCHPLQGQGLGTSSTSSLAGSWAGQRCSQICCLVLRPLSLAPGTPPQGGGTSRGSASSGLGTQGVPATSWADLCAPQHPATGAPFWVTESSWEKYVTGGPRPASSLCTAPRPAQAAPLAQPWGPTSAPASQALGHGLHEPRVRARPRLRAGPRLPAASYVDFVGSFGAHKAPVTSRGPFSDKPAPSACHTSAKGPRSVWRELAALGLSGLTGRCFPTLGGLVGPERYEVGPLSNKASGWKRGFLSRDSPGGKPTRGPGRPPAPSSLAPSARPVAVGTIRPTPLVPIKLYWYRPCSIQASSWSRIWTLRPPPPATSGPNSQNCEITGVTPVLVQRDFNTNNRPWLGGSVDGAPACEPKGHQFDSQSGHTPGLWAKSPVGGAEEATTH
ncbi:uncharacterized protein [Desmodus rotundus]|uniref:uncharacterized protein n=1 Tax=Desmodus rotundus TaxID=9430 RepID=UPI002380D8CD|nr:uncharacterized protein LOC123478092 [Desmodus rotundus]XP_045039454.2 uncharacterized protein LOC123478092 [Desmodus rotundus]XP_053781370.1 uncharacterized protein LOC123478092 [Desmodus rotundus]